MAEQPIIIKKKIIKGHAHHGGSWKVAYADFVTAMMAFFMVMWLMNMTQSSKDLVAGYFNDPLGFTSTSPKSRTILTLDGASKPKPITTPAKGTGDDSALADRSEQKILEEVRRKVEHELGADPKFKELAKNVQMSITDEGLVIEFVEAKGAVFFESASDKIRPEALKLVATITPTLVHSKHMVEIQGHTDAQPFQGRVNGNWRLGSDRASSVVDALMSDGMPDSQISGVKSFASTRLLDPKNPMDFKNRRVTILLPRKYDNQQGSMTPSDALKAAIDKDTEPEAVMLQPGKPNLKNKQGK